MSPANEHLIEALTGPIALPLTVAAEPRCMPRRMTVDLSGEAADRGAALTMGRRLGGPLDGLAANARRRGQVPVTLRALVADLVSELTGLREVLEGSVRPEDGPVEDDVAIMTALGSCAKRHFRLVEAIRAHALELDPGPRRDFRRFAQAELASLFEKSPFFYRARRRPRGPAWDHGLLGLLFGEALRGPSRFDRYLHAWLSRSALARGVRERERAIRRALVERLHRGRPLRAATVGAGPCMEVVRAFETARIPPDTELVLFDDDPEALVRAVRETQAALRPRGEGPSVRIRGTCTAPEAFFLDDDPRRRPVDLDGPFDVILAPILLDEHPDPVARPLLTGLEARLAPGGALLLGALAEGDGIDWLLEDALGWAVVRRSPAELERLSRGAVSPETRVRLEPAHEGASLTVRIERPDQAVAASEAPEEG